MEQQEGTPGLLSLVLRLGLCCFPHLREYLAPHPTVPWAGVPYWGLSSVPELPHPQKPQQSLLPHRGLNTPQLPLPPSTTTGQGLASPTQHQPHDQPPSQHVTRFPPLFVLGQVQTRRPFQF